MSCFYSFCLCDSCDIAHTVFNACILLNSYVPFTRTMIDFTETSSLKIFQPLIETLWGTPRPKDILGVLFVEVRLSFTISGTFELTKLILAVVCAPVAQRGELWEVSVASGPCAGTQLLLSFAHRKRWWYWCCGCWDFPLASYCPGLSTQLPRASACSCCACSAWPALMGVCLMCCYKLVL